MPEILTKPDLWLEKLDERVKFYSSQGYCCSQVVPLVGCERLNIKLSDDFLRGLSGFAGGMGCGITCGALIGGIALLGIYLGKATPEEARSQLLRKLSGELVQVFQAYWKNINCKELVNAENKKYVCQSLMAGTVEMVWGLLHENNIDLDKRDLNNRY